MNKFIDKYIMNIFSVYLLLIPILDALVSITNLDKIVYVIKILYLLLCLYYIFIIKKSNINYLSILLIYSTLFIFINPDILNIKTLVKILYLPVNLIFIYEMLKEHTFNRKILIYLLIIYLSLIFIPNILNIGISSYGSDAKEVGFLGVFSATNEVSNVLLLLFPMFIIQFDYKKIKYYLITILYLLVIFTIGTKTPIIGLIFILIYLFIYCILKLKKKNKIIVISSMLVLLVIAIIILPYTAIYKNILTRLNFYKIDSIIKLFDFNNIDHLIFSNRFNLLNNIWKIYVNTDIKHYLFGIGYIINGDILKTCEMDIFSIFIHHGVVGFVLLLFYYFKTIYLVFKTKIKVLNIKNNIHLLAICLSILCSLFSGHLLDEPSVTIVLALILDLYLIDYNN